MSDIKFRILFNAIALGFTTYQLVSSSGSDVMPLYFAMFAVLVFGCILSIVDYAKEKTNV